MSVLRARSCSSAFQVALLGLLVPLMSALPGAAQSSAEPAQPSPQPQAAGSQPPSVPSIATTVDEVSLDLVVRTKSGKPILDLKPSDLTITDNGSPVKLTDLHLVQGTTESDHLVTLVFDRLDPGPAKAARDLAAKLLKVIPDQGYHFAVLQMNGRLRLLQAWTTDRETVMKAVAGATSTVTNSAAQGSVSELLPAEKQLIATTQDDSLSTDFADRARARLLLSALEESQRILEDQHTYPALSALLALSRSERTITGRKFVIYFAQGLYADTDARDAVKSIVGQANRAGVTICAIDTNTMNQQVGDKMMGAMAMAGPTGPGGAMAAANSLGASGYGRGQSGPPIGQVMDAAQNMSSFEFDSMDEVKSPLINLASGTGGIYIRAGASLKKPLQQFQQSLTEYYEAAYVPGIKDYNGAFRPIEIHPLRKGIVVQSRAGYFAVPPDDGSGIRPFEVPLLSILAQPKLPTGIAFRTGVLDLGQTPDGNTGVLAVQVPLSQVQVHEDANTHLSTVHLSIVAQIRNEKGALVQRFSEDVPRHEAPDMLRLPENQFITMQRHFSAGPGTYTLETAVMDSMGNKTGAERSTFTIAATPHGPSLSDIALVRQIEPIHAETASFDPMRYMNGRIVPELNDELPEGTKDLSVFFLVHSLPAASGQPQLTMQIVRNGQSLGKMPLELSKTDGMGALPYLGTISGHVFPPGSYKIEATLTQDGQTATSTASFTVEGSIAAQSAPAETAFSATTGSAETASERAADEHLVTSAAEANSAFIIASSKDPVPPPTPNQVHTIVEAARQRALAWSDALPNFFCIEVTDHSVDPSGEGDWHHKDTAIQLMRYVDRQESRTTLELNGQKSNLEATDLDFAHSIGEFGGMFRLVFDPSAKAQFTWKESDVLDGQPVQVFAFDVALANSEFSLAGLNAQQIPVAFHGLVYLDTATHSIRRITITADDIPEKLGVRATSISVDYTWVAINGHDFLMPTRGAVSLREGKREAVLNEFEFRNYRRFGAQVRILSTAESKGISTNN